MDIRAALKGQYHGALAMLKQAIDRCPDDLWTAGGHPSPFWQIAYHAMFFTHLYLQPGEKSFRRWEQARGKYESLEPPGGDVYTKAELLKYWQACNAMIDAGVDRLDLDSPECGFWWYKMPKLDHQMMNIRHIQHHVGQLDDRLRLAGVEIQWKGDKPGGAPAKA